MASKSVLDCKITSCGHFGVDHFPPDSFKANKHRLFPHNCFCVCFRSLACTSQNGLPAPLCNAACSCQTKNFKISQSLRVHVVSLTAKLIRHRRSYHVPLPRAQHVSDTAILHILLFDHPRTPRFFKKSAGVKLSALSLLNSSEISSCHPFTFYCILSPELVAE